jgi:hypothetical protein
MATYGSNLCRTNDTNYLDPWRGIIVVVTTRYGLDGSGFEPR